MRGGGGGCAGAGGGQVLAAGDEQAERAGLLLTYTRFCISRVFAFEASALGIFISSILSGFRYCSLGTSLSFRSCSPRHFLEYLGNHIRAYAIHRIHLAPFASLSEATAL